MKRAAKILITLALILTILVPTSLASEISVVNIPTTINAGNYGKGYRYNIQGRTYIHLEGEPYERGYQYGYLAATEITNCFLRWAHYGHAVKGMKLYFLKNYDALSQKWWELCKSKAMTYFEKHVPEEHKQEMIGMKDGLNDRNAKIFGKEFTYEDIVASQFIQDVEYAFYSTFSLRKIHPIRNILHTMRDVLAGRTKFEDIGHCNAFIATGDSTENGDIIVAHATVFPKVIAERCNFIVDIKPSNGYRFMMTGPPGSLWSQEDYYQNEQGIVLTETELLPQGPFDIKKTPKGIRSRTAIQYSSSIDEVIQNLEKNNNGLVPNEWLIGDTKTGEIARLEQPLFNTVVTRKTDGYFFSCTTPHNDKVERELWGIMPKSIAIKVGFPNKYSSARIEKFNELEAEYHGKINTEIAKKIITTVPLCNSTSDCKITSTKLLENMGLIFYYGSLDGKEWVPSEDTIKKYREVSVLPPTGWLEIYDSNFKEKKQLSPINPTFKESNIKLIWNFDSKDIGNSNYHSLDVSEGVVFSAGSTGQVIAIEAETEKTIWDHRIADKTTEPTVYNELLFVGSDQGLHTLNKENGNIKWEQKIGEVISKPIIYRDMVIAGFLDGTINAFKIETGEKTWYHQFGNKPYLSQLKNNIVSIAADKSCYGFNLLNEEIIWEFKTEKLITSPPKITSNTVYFGSWDGNIYALDLKTGEQKWKFETGWGIDSTPTVDDGMVFVGSLDNRFYALDEDSGVLVWCFQCKSAVHSSPVVYGDLVFFGSDDGIFYALDKKTGNPDWSFTPGFSIKNNDVNNFVTTPILCDPVVENGVVYVSAKGNIYALDAQTIEIPNIPKTAGSHNNNNLIMMLIIVAISMLMISFVIFIKNKLF